MMAWRTGTSGLVRAAVMAAVLVAAPAGSVRAVGPDMSTLDQDPTYRTAVTAIRTARYEDAIPLFNMLLASHPDAPELYSWLGFAHRKLKNYPLSKQYYDRALLLNPDYLPALEYQGMWYIEMGDVDAAERNYRRLIALCDGCEETRDLGEALRAAGRIVPSP
jgi:tetratricopeptide (TPR) repeat protein